MPTQTPAPETRVDAVIADDLDLAVLVGTLSRDPVVRELPSGSVLVRYEVTVRDQVPADTVPVSWVDPPRPAALAEGDRVVVVGRVRRRFFRAGGVTRSSTEVAATSVRRAASSRDAVAALDDARSKVDRPR